MKILSGWNISLSVFSVMWPKYELQIYSKAKNKIKPFQAVRGPPSKIAEHVTLLMFHHQKTCGDSCKTSSSDWQALSILLLTRITITCLRNNCSFDVRLIGRARKIRSIWSRWMASNAYLSSKHCCYLHHKKTVVTSLCYNAIILCRSVHCIWPSWFVSGLLVSLYQSLV